MALPISIYGRKNRLSSSISGWKAIFTVNLMQSNEKLLLQIFIRRLSKILFDNLRKGKPFLPWRCFRFPVCSAAIRRHSAAVLVGGDHAYATAQPRACVDQEQPLRDATRYAPILQLEGACASAAQGMRCCMEGEPLAVDELERNSAF